MPDQQIHTTSYACPLGELHISFTGEAIQSIKFADEPLVEATREISPVLEQCMSELDAYFAGENRSFSFPMNQAGTAFQQRVWDALRTIPYGRTISYRDLSKQLGDVKAIRAVGTANGRNDLAIVVPCHRVIGSDGKLVGYAGKLWRKQWLLRHEAKFGHGVQSLF